MKIKVKTLNSIIYLLIIISFILLVYFIILKSNTSNSNLVDTFISPDLNPCIGSYYYPKLSKCPPERKYAYPPPNNVSSGVCCGSEPANQRNQDTHGCVEGKYRPHPCFKDERVVGHSNNMSGYCCKKKNPKQKSKQNPKPANKSPNKAKT